MKYPVSFELELKKNPYKGLYIALEGIDGSGKTTQADSLAKYFKDLGREVVVTAEPTRDTEIGRLIHRVLRQELSVSKVAIQYLFAADRAVHQEKFIIPALKSGKVVISDRCFWSSVAYGILDRDGIKNAVNISNYLLVSLSILSLYHQFIAPDATFYLNVGANTAAKRLALLKRKAELYEKEELLNKAKEVYDWMVQEFDEAFVIVKADQEKEKVTQEIIKAIEKL